MKGPRFGEPELFEAFLTSAQYLVRLQSHQDIWEHLGKFVLTHFSAAWVAVVERNPASHFSLHYCTLPETAARARILTKEVESLVADVLESGFLTSRVLLTPGPSMTALLPVVENDQTSQVLLVGHNGAQPIPKSLMNIYLALAGLAGAATERTRAEEAERRLNAELEQRVIQRTAQLQTTNDVLLKEIAERRRVEEALRLNREQLRVTLTSIGDAVITTDTAGLVTFLNPVAATLTGWSPEAAQGQPIRSVFRIVNEQTRVPAEDVVLRVLKEKRIAELANHTALISRDGREVSIEDSAAPILDSAGKVTGVVLVFRDVTEKRRVQERIVHLASFPERNPAFIFETDLEGRITYVNPAARGQFSTLEEPGHPLLKEWSPILASLRAGAEPPTAREVESNGLTLLQTISYLPQLGVVRAYCVDITARKRAELALRESEARYRSLFENMLNGFAYCRMIFVDGQPQDFVYLAVNPAFEKLTGLKNVVGKRVSEIIPGLREADPHLFELYGKVAQTGVPVQFETYVEALGNWFSVSVYSSAPEYFTVVFDVITARKRAEEALQVEQQLLETVVNYVPAAVVLAEGHDLKFRLVNPAYQALAPGKDMVGKTLEEVWPEIGSEVPSIWRRVLATGEPHTAEDESFMVRRIPDGPLEPVYFSWSVFRVRLPGNEGWGLLNAAFETTQRKLAEQAMVRAEKLAAAGRMAATVAHEVNNPLAAVMNSVYIALMDPAMDESTRQHLQTAEQELVRIAGLTRQTLGFYRERSAAGTVSVAELLDDVLRTYEHKLRNKNAQVTKEIAAQITATTVVGELRQVLSNLIANSIDALPERGTLHIRAHQVGTDGHYQRRLMITVADTGMGIPPELRERIFEPFFTTKEEIGTGLGLWVTRELLRKNGGSIRLRSRPGLGTVFTIFLPARLAAAATVAAH